MQLKYKTNMAMWDHWVNATERNYGNNCDPFLPIEKKRELPIIPVSMGLQIIGEKYKLKIS